LEAEWNEKGQRFTALVAQREEWGSHDIALEIDVCYCMLWSTIDDRLIHRQELSVQQIQVRHDP
jgi:hypothetical protein